MPSGGSGRAGEAGAPSVRPRGGFGRLQRVRKRFEFQQIQTRGRRVTTPHFALVLHGRAAGSGPRLGITASRKTGNAVRRNRAKRLIREAFRATRGLWPEDMDVVVVVRRPLGDLRLAEVVAEWESAAPAIRRRVREARKDRDRRQSALAQTP